MEKIEQLTPEEEALIPIVRDEWLKIGLATGPADREAAQAAIADAYHMAGLEPLELWIWLGSPHREAPSVAMAGADGWRALTCPRSLSAFCRRGLFLHGGLWRRRIRSRF